MNRKYYAITYESYDALHFRYPDDVLRAHGLATISAFGSIKERNEFCASDHYKEPISAKRAYKFGVTDDHTLSDAIALSKQEEEADQYDKGSVDATFINKALVLTGTDVSEYEIDWSTARYSQNNGRTWCIAHKDGNDYRITARPRDVGGYLVEVIPYTPPASRPDGYIESVWGWQDDRWN